MQDVHAAVRKMPLRFGEIDYSIKNYVLQYRERWDIAPLAFLMLKTVVAVKVVIFI